MVLNFQRVSVWELRTYLVNTSPLFSKMFWRVEWVLAEPTAWASFAKGKGHCSTWDLNCLHSVSELPCPFHTWYTCAISCSRLPQSIWQRGHWQSSSKGSEFRFSVTCKSIKQASHLNSSLVSSLPHLFQWSYTGVSFRFPYGRRIKYCLKGIKFSRIFKAFYPEDTGPCRERVSFPFAYSLHKYSGNNLVGSRFHSTVWLT